MSREDALARGREAAEGGMTDTCEIGVKKKSTTLDPDTLLYETSFTVVYAGPCEFKAGTTAAQEIAAANQELVEQDSTLKLPIGPHPAITAGTSADVTKNHVVRILTSETDPGLVGTVARIKGPSVGSYTTARRFAVEVTT